MSASTTTTLAKEEPITIHIGASDNSSKPKDDIIRVAEEDYRASKYPDWLPTWDPKEKHDAQSDDFNKSFVDRGHLADKDLKDFLGTSETIQIKTLSPKLGSEVRGVQLSELSDAAKNDLALFVAQRGVVVFRDQDLKDKGLEFNKQFGEYFGPLQIHPATGAPEGYSKIHIVYQKHPDSKRFATKLSGRGWHTDSSYIKYPPGTTFFAHLEGPETGGDTIFSDTEEAYNRLSPTFQKIISGLKGGHTFSRLVSKSKDEGGIERVPTATVWHPLVRVHPVTKRKAIYVTAFVKEIQGLKKEESDAILNLLFDHVNHSHDFQVRASYEPGTVVVWDNRRVAHASTLDWESDSPRHMYRLTPLAERPVGSEEELEEWNK